MTQAIDIEIPACHPSQERFLGEAKRFNVLVAGRRFGKNVVALHRLAPLALTGWPVGFFSPSYKLLAESWRDFKTMLEPAIVRCSEQEKRIELRGGGVIEFWSLHDDDNAGRSRKYKRVVVDEAGQIANLEHVFNNAIRPTLTDLVGDADLMGTPRGRGFFWRCYCRGQDPEQPNWGSWRFPSSDNPHLPPGEIEQARLELPDRVFRQEYLAEFLDDAGGVFRNVHAAIDKGRTNAVEAKARAAPVEPCARPSGPYRKREEKALYFMGLDLARVNDFTVVSILDSTGKQVYWDRWNQISWERQISGILEVAKKFNPYIFVDATGIGDPIFERLKKSSLRVTPFHFTNASKTELIDNLAGAIEQGKIRLLDEPVQTGELVNYEYKVTASRNVTMSAPEGEHDDCVIALALAYFGQRKPGLRMPLLARL
jgi:hypothetical protein